MKYLIIANLINSLKRSSRHPGMDRRDPEYKDVFVDIALLFIKSPLTPLFQRGGLNSNIKSSIKISWWIYYECHPWQLDPGDPCRDDGSTICGIKGIKGIKGTGRK